MRISAAHTLASALCLVLVASSAACGSAGGSDVPDGTTEVSSSALSADALAGRELFEHATFGGNGRTCATCHTKETGTLSPEQIRELDRDNPIFRPIDSDDGVGHSYKRLLKSATIRVTLDLPPNIRLHDNPTAKKFTVNRSIPTVNNSSLFPILMWDGRESNLATQALNAVHAHFQETREPTPLQLGRIATYEGTLFTNNRIEKYAHGGAAPVLPEGHTASEKRGRAFFNADGACGSCHSGPMLNVSNENNPLAPTGSLVNVVFAGYQGGMGFPQPEDSPNPVVMWDLDCPTNDGGAFCDFFCPVFGQGSVTNNVCTMPMPDPGQAIPSGDPGNFLFFKTPSLWGVSKTSPYFHDNSANTLEDVMAHYDKFFQFLFGFGISTQNGLSAQEQKDLVAFVKLL